MMVRSLNRNFADGLDCKREINLADFSSMKIGGVGSCIITPHSLQDLESIIKLCSRYDYIYRVRGNGSNTIFGDLPEVLINTAKLQRILLIRIDDTVIKEDEPFNFEEVLKNLSIGHSVEMEIEAGASLPKLSQLTAFLALTGLEYGIGIPGTVGGATVMNAGCLTYETAAVVSYVKVMYRNGNLDKLRDLNYGYRNSILQDIGNVVYSVGLRLKKGNKEDIYQTLKRLKSLRKNQPSGNSCGSVFLRRNNTRHRIMDSYNDRTSYYSDDILCAGNISGWTSESGAIRIPDGPPSRLGWFVARPGATSWDFLELASRVYHHIYETQGFKLSLEIKLIGNTPCGKPLTQAVSELFNSKTTLQDGKSNCGYK